MMCCLYGILDYKQNLSLVQKNQLLRQLSIACEQRGTDATGIAYNQNGHLEIHKKPLPAHNFRQKIPAGVNVVMGHTRLTTKGNAKRNDNNHPFYGCCENTAFALAHNGVLCNEKKLRKAFHLPVTQIETDSYVAVQMIEKTGAFTLQAIQKMAEEVEGSFCFTVLDEQNTLYLVKGNNPLVLYHFEKMGFYIYASTKEILKKGLKKAGFLRYPHKEVKIKQGDILILQADGTQSRASFDTKKLDYYDTFLYGCGVGYGYDWKVTPFKHSTTKCTEYGVYLEILIDYAVNVGISEEEILYLYQNGFTEEEIETLLYSPEILREYVEELMELGYV